MPHPRSFHHHATLAYGSIALLATACSPQSFPESQGTPNTRIAEQYETAVAKQICQYSISKFPNWPLHPEFEKYMTDSEKSAVTIVADALIADLPAEHLPKYNATAKFIAQNTQCTLLNRVANNGQIQVTFEQKSPIVPVEAMPKITKISAEAFEQAWLKAFNEAWKPDQFVSREIPVLLQYDGDSLQVVSQIESSFARPIEINQQLTNLTKAQEVGDFVTAQTALQTYCKLDPGIPCNALKTQLHTAQQVFDQNIKFITQNIEFTDERMVQVQPPSANAYTALSLKITNKSDQAVTHLTLKTNEKKTQYCLLQSERTHRKDKLLTLEPGQTATAWCALHEMTMPNTRAQLIWLDQRPPKNTPATADDDPATAHHDTPSEPQMP